MRRRSREMGLQLRYCSKMRQSNFLHQHWAIFKYSVSLSRPRCVFVLCTDQFSFPVAALCCCCCCCCLFCALFFDSSALGFLFLLFIFFITFSSVRRLNPASDSWPFLSSYQTHHYITHFLTFIPLHVPFFLLSF